ncbi:cytochrome c peroxidase [Shimia sp.]|uniref:cytochrome-c peroxidase n=1 Tax=Shimia sp. TaxID=1954381 RepID=UPI00329866FC
MEITSYAALPALLLGLLVGVTALSLVANELGKRARLSVPSRFVLSGALGMGVLSVGIKVLILSVLLQTDGQALAHSGRAVRETLRALVPVEAVQPEPADTQPLGFRTWRALPRQAPEPRDNRSSEAKIALGKMLFHDKNLSLDRSVSCASCHILTDGGDDNAPTSTGYLGQTGDRNAPTVLNAAFLTRLFWDGRAASLELQAKGPFTNLVEMAMPSLAAVEDRVAQNQYYRATFQSVLPDKTPINIRNITRAIAAYERTLITPDAPYDRYVRGDDAALSEAALRGMALFDEFGCRGCHVDPVFSAAGSEKPLGVYRRFPVYPQNNAYMAQYDLLIAGAPSRYRVPSLHNVARTAPYFHNGSVETLQEAIRVMAVSQLGREITDDPIADIRVVAASVSDSRPGRNLSLVRGHALSRQDVSDIEQFLRALTDTTIPD